MVTDYRSDYLNQVRPWLSLIVYPVQWISDLPGRMIKNTSEVVMSQSVLIEENAKLKAYNLMLEQKLQKYAELTVQNVKLRELLNSSKLVDDRVVIAAIIGIDPNPYMKYISIDKGSHHGVYQGQPILDAYGIMGQVTSVGILTSKVMLVTDSGNRIPVQINRTGYRAIAAGTGMGDNMELLHVPDTEDVQEGDLLVSSGLGLRFPVGYPVAKIKKIRRDTGRPFAYIMAKPAADLNSGRLVMLVFTLNSITEGAISKQLD